MIQTSHEVIVFTDGSSRGNPGPGGFGAIIIAPKNNELGSKNYEVKEIGGREEHTTNNRMELRAAISALSFLSSLRIKDKGLRIAVYSDSSYLIKGITAWIHGWQKNGWKTKAKQDVGNKDLWEKLAEISRNKKIEWKQIEGHAGVAGNVRCDDIAQMFADATPMDADKIKLYHGPLSEYPIKNVLDVAHDSEAVERKKTGRAHSNAKAYSYVSMVNGLIQKHKTWAECERRVKGKRGARYKKVFSLEEERALIAEWQRK